ncbi:MAG: CopG family transcriptional regulator [Acidimicrobiales bacterium]
MSATRTQIYLTDELRAAIDRVAEAEGVTMAEVIRRAVSAYVDEVTPDSEPALAATFGAAPDAEMPDRDSWDRG